MDGVADADALQPARRYADQAHSRLVQLGEQHMAGVDDDVLAEKGPIHREVAEQLTIGARDRVDADYGVGVTGVAGPGAQGDRPVGEVHVGIASRFGVTSREYHFDGSRADIRAASADAALADLVGELDRQCERTTSA